MSRLEQPLHFIGIGGSGMSALAELALKRNYLVQGTDLAHSSNVQKLALLGIPIARKHSAEALAEAGTVIFSSAIPAENPELAAARAKGMPCLHRAEFLAHLMEDHQGITVAGTHGKTTTSAMITHVLDVLGQDPTAAIGGTMRRYGSAARHGEGRLFVAEADESDGSFLKYKPYIAVLTNIDSDHMEFFKDQDGLEKAFLDYLNCVDEDGVSVIGWDQPIARQVASQTRDGLGGHRLTYGFLIGSEVRAVNYRIENGETRFDAVVERDVLSCRLKTLGRHNVMNALCALAVVRALELDTAEAALALESYEGVDRRLALIHDDSHNPHIRIYDDYAHNPGKIMACIQAVREAYPDRDLHVVYQPHRYSRLETLYEEMLGSLEGADLVHVLPVYTAGESTREDYSPSRLSRDINLRGGTKAVACGDFTEAVKSLSRTTRRKSVVLTLGAGDVFKVAHLFKETL